MKTANGDTSPAPGNPFSGDSDSNYCCPDCQRLLTRCDCDHIGIRKQREMEALAAALLCRQYRDYCETCRGTGKTDSDGKYRTHGLELSPPAPITCADCNGSGHAGERGIAGRAQEILDAHDAKFLRQIEEKRWEGIALAAALAKAREAIAQNMRAEAAAALLRIIVDPEQCLEAHDAPLIERAEKAERERDALAAAVPPWRPIAEFAARKRHLVGEKILLLPVAGESPRLMRVLPEEWHYDFADHEKTYYEARLFSHWMESPAHPESEKAQEAQSILAAHHAEIRRPLEEEIARLRALLRDIATSGVEQDDERIKWLTVQIGRKDWEALQKAVKNDESKIQR